MKQRWWIIAVILVLAVGGIVAYQEKTSAEAKAKAAVSGRTATVGRGDITIKVTETGTLEPVTQVDIKSRVAGRLLKIYVKEGQEVHAGDPIAIVDPTEVARQVAGIKAQLTSSKAALAQAEETYNLTVRQNRLAIVKSEVGLKQAIAAYKDSEVLLRQAQAQYEGVAAPNRVQDITSADLAVSRAEANLADTQRTFERQKNLVSKGFVAQSTADAAQVQVTFAEKDLDTAREHLALLKEGPRKEDVATAKVGIEAAQAQLDQQQAAVQAARVQLETDEANADTAVLRKGDVDRARADVAQTEYNLEETAVSLTETRIVSPIDGEVTGKYLEEGELIASATAGFAQGAAVVSIADLTHMQVRVNINEVDVANVQVGQPVEITVDGVPEKKFIGRVSAIAESAIGKALKADPSTATSSSSAGVVRFEVKVGVDNADRRLRTGMTAVTDIILQRHHNVLTLPAEAIKPGDKVALVIGTGKTRTTEDHKVTVGLKNDASVEIVDGLKEGDVVEIPKIDAKDRRKISFDMN